jgi:hypothetical protein
MNKPNFFVVGEPKSGTTALHEFLNQHPQITMSRVKEPYHFCTDLHEESDRFHGKKLYFKYRDKEKYFSLFDNDKKYKASGESSTFYIWSKEAARNIYNFNADSKIIIFLRNPIDFIQSLHSHWVAETYENIYNFNDALSAEAERKNDWAKIPSRAYFPSMLFYTSMVDYSRQVGNFLNVFDREQIKIVIFENFLRNNATIFKEILHFLEVDATFIPKFEKVNTSKKPRSKTINYIAQNIYFLEIMKKILPYNIHKKVKKIGQNILWEKTNRKQICDALYFDLSKKFNENVESISDILHMDMKKKWNLNV